MIGILLEIDRDTRTTRYAQLVHNDVAHDVAAQTCTPAEGEYIVIGGILAAQTGSPPETTHW